MSELIDRQSFIEQERKLYCEDCDRRKGTKNGKPNVICYEIGEAPCRACWLDDALGDLEDFPTASPWHRVEEPPKYTGRYIVWCGVNWHGEGMYDDFMIARYDARLGRWYVEADESLNGPICGHIRYWMPIEPPREDE